MPKRLFFILFIRLILFILSKGSSTRILVRSIMQRYRLVLIFLLFHACSTVPDKKLVENGLTLRYLPVSAIGEDIAHIHLEHPVQITEDWVRIHLASLWYEGMTSLGREGRVFSESDVNKASRLVTKALNQAKPDHIVQLELATASGPTDVEVFVESGRIHWRFQLIKGAVFSCDISNANCMHVNWRMIPKDNQRYYSTQKLLGAKNMENWIVADINPLTPGQNREARPGKRSAPVRENEAKSDKDPKSQPAGLEERLFYLKQLYEKGLITEEEFKRNQKKIMDEKF